MNQNDDKLTRKVNLIVSKNHIEKINKYAKEHDTTPNKLLRKFIEELK